MARARRRARDLLIGSLLAAVGGVWALSAARHTIGEATNPGPGYFPFVIGTGLALVGLAIGRMSLRPDGASEGTAAGAGDAIRVGGYLLLLGVYTVALRPLGFLLAGFGVMVGLYAMMGSRRPLRVLPAAVTSAALAYLAFRIWLGIPLPIGLLDR